MHYHLTDDLDVILSECDAAESYDEYLDEFGPVTVLGFEWDTSHVLREIDPTAYRCGFLDYMDPYTECWEIHEVCPTLCA